MPNQSERFGFKTMDELQLEIVNDRLRSFDGNQVKAAESLGVHRHTIDNILKRAEKTAVDEEKENNRILAQQKDDLRLRMEGYERDPETGRSRPVALSPARGIENALLFPRDYSKDEEYIKSLTPEAKPETKIKKEAKQTA